MPVDYRSITVSGIDSRAGLYTALDQYAFGAAVTDFWYKASNTPSFLTSLSLVYGWNDSGGKGYDLITTSATPPGVVTINGFDAVYFDDWNLGPGGTETIIASDELEFDAMDTGEIWMVTMPRSHGSNTTDEFFNITGANSESLYVILGYLSGPPASWRVGMGWWSGTGISSNTGRAISDVVPSARLDEWNVIRITCSGTYWQLYVNTVPYSWTTFGNPGNIDGWMGKWYGQVNSPFEIKMGSNGYRSGHNIAEVKAFTTLLSSAAAFAYYSSLNTIYNLGL